MGGNNKTRKSDQKINLKNFSINRTNVRNTYRKIVDRVRSYSIKSTGNNRNNRINE